MRGGALQHYRPVTAVAAAFHHQHAPVTGEPGAGPRYLAFCPPDEQEIILGLLAQSTDPEDEPAADLQKVMATLEEVRTRGYAVRNPAVRPVSNTLALPIFENGRVAASFGLTWFSSALSQEEAVSTLYPAMKEAADKISARLKALDGNSKQPAMKAARAPSRKKPATVKRAPRQAG